MPTFRQKLFLSELHDLCVKHGTYPIDSGLWPEILFMVYGTGGLDMIFEARVVDGKLRFLLDGEVVTNEE